MTIGDWFFRRHRTRAQKIRDLAWTLFIAPTGGLLPITILTILHPAALVEHPDMYLTFYAGPYAAAAGLGLYARRLRAREKAAAPDARARG
ncbi:MAG TPA: hypothetical protein VF702_01055 [Allosphingosinicella sp.]|jgi:hypothetical protein